VAQERRQAFEDACCAFSPTIDQQRLFQQYLTIPESVYPAVELPVI